MHGRGDVAQVGTSGVRRGKVDGSEGWGGGVSEACKSSLKGGSWCWDRSQRPRAGDSRALVRSRYRPTQLREGRRRLEAQTGGSTAFTSTAR